MTVTNAAVTTATGENVAYGSGIESLYVNAQDGNDTINAAGATRDVTLWGGGGSDQVTGGSGNDSLFDDESDWCGGGPGCPPPPSAGNDTLNGGAGQDSIFVARGHDTVDGGPGGDYVEVALGTGATAAVTDTGPAPAGPADSDIVSLRARRVTTR